MYRYGQPPRSARSKHKQTLLILALLILLIVSISLFIAYRSASRIGANTREVLTGHIFNEVSLAKASAYQLTPTSGSKAASMISIVRQHVYATRTLNELSNSIYGVSIANETTLNNCIAYLDECDLRLQKGTTRSETYTSLRTAIDELQAQMTGPE